MKASGEKATVQQHASQQHEQDAFFARETEQSFFKGKENGNVSKAFFQGGDGAFFGTGSSIQAKAAVATPKPDIQRESEQDNQQEETDEKFENKLNNSKGGGAALPPDTREEMESAFGADFSGVKIHTNEQANNLSQNIGAQAFTHGNDIYFNQGKYEPETKEGKELLAHELTHTIQQGVSVRRKEISPTPGPRVQRLFGIDLRSILNKVARLIPGYTLITVIAGYNPILGKEVERTGENILDGIIGLIPGGAILADRLQETGALADAGNWLITEVKRLGLSLSYIKSLFARAWDELSITKGISGNLEVLKRVFGEPYRKIKRFAANVAGKIKEFIFRGALKLVGAPVETIMGILNKGKEVLMSIISDPIGFFKKIAGAVGRGIKSFVKNIKTHLVSGLFGWLMGAMGDLPINFPSKFDLKGIFDLVLQVLGLTYNRIRRKVVKVVGEKPVALAEKAVSVIKRIVTEGPIALWDMIREKAGEIKNSLLDGIKNWVVTKVVKSGVVQLLSMLNPAGAIVQAAMKIYQFIMFLKDNISRIASFVGSIFNSIGEIARGAIGSAAKFIEGTMAKSIPMILSFLARMLNLSGIGKAIQNVLKKIRRPVDKIVTKVVMFLTRKIRGLFGKGKGAKKDDPNQKFTQKDKDKGLKAFEKEEKAFVKNGEIGKANAEKVAISVRKKHPVFKKISVVDGKDSWNYKYVFKAEGEVDTRSKKGEEEKAVNLDQVKHLLNKPIPNNFKDSPPEGYEIFNIKGNGEFQIRRKKGKKKKNYLQLSIIWTETKGDDPKEKGHEGKIVEGKKKSNRISSPGELAKAVDGADAKNKKLNHQYHHKIPDAIVRKHELMNFARKELGYNLDRKSNGLRMPSNKEGQKITNRPIHNGSHPIYNSTAEAYLDDIQLGLLREENETNIENINPSKINNAIVNAEKDLEIISLNSGDKLS